MKTPQKRSERSARPARMRVTGTNRYLEMVERHFDIRVRTGDEFMCMCPWHDNHNSPSLQINVSTGDYLCFNPACGAKGGSASLRRHCGERSDDATFDLIEVRERLKMLTTGIDRDAQIAPVDESRLDRYLSIPTSYWTERGFDQKIIEAFQLGYDPMEDHAIIPIRNRQGQLLGVIRRDLDPDCDVKYLYPKGFKKSRELFGSWFAQESDSSELVLVEGSVDAMMCWQAGFTTMAQYGSRISPEQIRIIRRMGFTRIVLFFDNDFAGKAATKACMGWIKHMRGGKERWIYDPELDLRRSFLVDVVEYKRLMPKDPGACDTVTIATAVVTAQRAM